MSLDGQARLSAHLQAVASALEETLAELAGEKVLFSLIVYGEGRDYRAQYVANSVREDCIAAMEQLLKRWKETGADDGPYHVYRKGN